MKKLIAMLLCLLLALPCLAAAEESVDLEALQARLTAYKAELEAERAVLETEIAEVKANVEYVVYVLDMTQAQLEMLQGEKKALDAKLTAAEQALAQPLTAENAQAVEAILPPPPLTGKHYVQIDIAGHAPIVAELDADAAPITVTNFVKLVNEGFYDGLTFHRIIEGFMMQGGDPQGNGTGGSAAQIKGEFSQNGWNNPIKHERGVLSMARSSAPNSASSQFFIMHQTAPHLDGAYAAFGRVLSGIDTVDAICANTPVTDGNGSVARENQPVITSIRVIEKPAE